MSDIDDLLAMQGYRTGIKVTGMKQTQTPQGKAARPLFDNLIGNNPATRNRALCHTNGIAL